MMAGKFRWLAMAAVAILLSCGASAQAAGPEKLLSEVVIRLGAGEGRGL
jgi:hypothetical protein